MKRLCCRTIKCAIKWVFLLGIAVFLVHWLLDSERLNADADCTVSESECTKRLLKIAGMYVGGVLCLSIIVLPIIQTCLVGGF